MKSVDASKATAANDVVVVTKGQRCAQVTPIVVPGTALALVGLRIGQTGDPVPLTIAGQTFEITGHDQTEGVSLALLDPASPAAGVVQFFLGMVDQ